ncbi:hypothetical protein CLV92_104117 [Kineococcus xinjiangensis]|uniref:Uncharacterized protein n=1 Tax=Kineococcus xinjiangensis TaxID=512762 RepID=A0A2S6ISU0_9ACTN|nr:hypothetical protein [Kineococcus xinjiangensis]PPK97298.1 hypothetical protein CLV92_104117 [Kineococcus xinjiangensis]
MSVSTVATRGTTRAIIPSPRTTARRHHAAGAAIAAAISDSGCIVISTTVSDSGCVVEFYDARSLSRALDVMAGAARAIGEDALASRAAQTGADAWRVTAGPQSWRGEDGDPRQAATRSHTAWKLTIPGDDLAVVATSLLV